ncbi:hypothetical protein CcCBS67573_g00796 [Chytriomyces confervae]|uniref:Ras-GEF domain-containing protein n=1 Tax=Chytriomyces confervae TaxID=246404 RepID=A0A507FR34_9FUNG|nr:hypothetical protein HDU80_009756 [Chytriomyces hyalinus]TPX77908.1 hypothetical protein CcCBS67573_g00796 [Chytriomyces confervae]
MTIDERISRADNHLARGDLRKAYLAYLRAIRDIVTLLINDTRFDETPTPASPRCKNSVVLKPADSDRLFGLAHLCFTEAEDIANGDINFDDLDDPSDDSGESSDDSTASLDLQNAQPNQTSRDQPAKSTNESSEPVIENSYPISSRRHSNASSISNPASFSPFSDFRQTRLSRPRSIRNSVKNSVRLSILALGHQSDAFQEKDEHAETLTAETEGFENPALSADLRPADLGLVVKGSLEQRDFAESSQVSIDSYVPLIPTSPLQHQHTHMLQSYSRCVQDLERLNTSTTISNAQALQTLTLVRRLMETTTLLKNKITSVSTEIAEASTKHVLDFSPRQLAVNITLCDWDMFSSLISLKDLLQFTTKSVSGTSILPRSFRACMDLSIFISRLVMTSILTPSTTSHGQSSAIKTHSKRASVGSFGATTTVASNSNSHAANGASLSASHQHAAKVISHWIQTLPILHSLRNYQSLHAVWKALSHPCIKRLHSAWALVNKKTRALLVQVDALFESSNGPPSLQFSAYRAQVAHAMSPLIPLLGLFVDDLKANGQDAGSFAQLQGCLENWRSVSNRGTAGTSVVKSFLQSGGESDTVRSGGGGGGGNRAYADEAKEQSPQVLHWILSRGWVQESVLWDMSLDLEADGGGGGQNLLSSPVAGGSKTLFSKLKGFGKNVTGKSKEDVHSSSSDSNSNLARDPNDHVYDSETEPESITLLQTKKVEAEAGPSRISLPTSGSGEPSSTSDHRDESDNLDISALRARLEALKQR